MNGKGECEEVSAVDVRVMDVLAMGHKQLIYNGTYPGKMVGKAAKELY